jgi:hypothetical protein
MFPNYPQPVLENGPTGTRENHPPISNMARANNVASSKYGSRCYRRAVLIPVSRTPDKPTVTVTVSNHRRNLEALLSPRISIGAQEFRKLALAKPGLFLISVAAFLSLVRSELEVITPSQNLCRSIGCPDCLTRTQIWFPPLSPVGYSTVNNCAVRKS